MKSEIEKPEVDLRCQTEKCWDKIDKWVSDHFVLSIVGTLLLALGPLVIIPFLS